MAEVLCHLTHIERPTNHPIPQNLTQIMLCMLQKALMELTMCNHNLVRTNFHEPLVKAMRGSGVITKEATDKVLKNRIRLYIALTQKMRQSESFAGGKFTENDFVTGLAFKRVLDYLHKIGEQTKYDRRMRRSSGIVDLHE